MKTDFSMRGLGPHHFDKLSAAPDCDDWSACRFVPSRSTLWGSRGERVWSWILFCGDEKLGRI